MAVAAVNAVVVVVVGACAGAGCAAALHTVPWNQVKIVCMSAGVHMPAQMVVVWPALSCASELELQKQLL
jgi:uncharacterized membrane protein YgdD (TMEM256/DUF423 family)